MRPVLAPLRRLRLNAAILQALPAASGLLDR
jgi:hypothetical protein